MAVIRLTTLIRAPIEVCFDLARSVDAHVASAADTGERAVEGVTTGLVSLGDEVTWEATHFGVRQRLRVRITECDPPRRFTDEGAEGDGGGGREVTVRGIAGRGWVLGRSGVESRFHEVESRLLEVKRRSDDQEARLLEVESSSDDVESRFHDVESRSDDVESRFHDVESRSDDEEPRFHDAESQSDEEESRSDHEEPRFHDAESQSDNEEPQLHEVESRLHEVGSRFHDAESQPDNEEPQLHEVESRSNDEE